MDSLLYRRHAADPLNPLSIALQHLDRSSRTKGQREGGKENALVPVVYVQRFI